MLNNSDVKGALQYCKEICKILNTIVATRRNFENLALTKKGEA
jgi:hypothetical protein